MDLGAYVQIEDLESLMKANGINIPRLRGLRLMSNEKPYDKDEIEECLEDAALCACQWALWSMPSFSYKTAWIESSEKTDKLCKKYLKYAPDGWRVVGIRWDRLHGKKRKFIKMRVRQAVKGRKREIDMWNKYAGRDDVLYIHAKIGDGNWSDYHWRNFIKEPWFLEAMNDPDDKVYCNIYAKIDKHAGEAMK